MSAFSMRNTLMQYEDIQKELHNVQIMLDSLDGFSFSLSQITKMLREQVARIELGVQHTIDTQDDLK